MRIEMLIVVRGCMGTTTLFFEVGAIGWLQRVEIEDSIVLPCTFQRIQVIGIHDRQWHIDPDPDSIVGDQEWRLWTWESRPLARLQWNSEEWQWRDSFASVNKPPILLF